MPNEVNHRIWKEINELPSAQPEQDREFMKLTVRNSKGRPYYSIIYLEFDDNGIGHDFEGYSSYSLDVISDYLKKYFMPSAQPERKKGRWIETEGLDEEIRCTMCTNPMRSDRGCDGSCQYDEKLYKQIMSIIKDRIDGGGA